MRPYETLVVLSTNLGEEGSQLLSRFETVIRNEGGTIDENRDWGVRDLAYPIGKQKQGHFWLIEYQAEPTLVKELERNLRISEGVLRFVSVQQEHTGLPEPRVREQYDRRDVPLNEMRSNAPAAAEVVEEVATEAVADVADGQETAAESPAAAEDGQG